MAYEWLTCGDETDTSLVTRDISMIDTLHGITMFVIHPEEADSNDLGSDTLFSYMVDFGGTTGYTPGQLYKNSSFSNFIVTCDINPGLNGKFFILPHTGAMSTTYCWI